MFYFLAFFHSLFGTLKFLPVFWYPDQWKNSNKADFKISSLLLHVHHPIQMTWRLLNVINVWMIFYLITPGNAVYEYLLVPPFSSYVLVLPVKKKNMNVLYKTEIKTKNLLFIDYRKISGLACSCKLAGVFCLSEPGAINLGPLYWAKSPETWFTWSVS